MENPRLQLKVGLFVFIGLVLLAVLLIQFSKSSSLFRGIYVVRLHATNVGGIKTRAQVLLAGVQVGTVTDIKLAPDDRSVTITLSIYKDYPIYQDARFAIEQAGFLGDQFISIVPTDNQPPVLTNNSDVECSPPFNLLEVARSASGFIQRIDATAKKLDQSVSDLQSQVLNAHTLSSFGVAMTNMRSFTEQALEAVQDIHQMVATNSVQVSMAVSNLEGFSTSLDRLGAQAGGILASNGQNMDITTSNLVVISGTLRRVSENLEAGNGLAGALLQNQALATNVQMIAANLAVTSSNLNRLGLWGVLWSHKPAPAPAHSSQNP